MQHYTLISIIIMDYYFYYISYQWILFAYSVVDEILEDFKVFNYIVVSDVQKIITYKKICFQNFVLVTNKDFFSVSVTKNI